MITMTARMERIRVLNNQAGSMLAAEEYDNAILALRSALEELRGHARVTFLDANRFGVDESPVGSHGSLPLLQGETVHSCQD